MSGGRAAKIAGGRADPAPGDIFARDWKAAVAIAGGRLPKAPMRVWNENEAAVVGVIDCVVGIDVVSSDCDVSFTILSSAAALPL